MPEKNRKVSIVLRDDGSAMYIDGDIAHFDFEREELFKNGKITEEQNEALKIHIHNWREAKAGIYPPCAYRNMGSQNTDGK